MEPVGASGGGGPGGGASGAWWDLGDGRRQELASGPDAVARYQVARAEWKLLTAAALVGLTERALGIAVEFARTRETMGVPIGSLQGVAFPLADVAIGISGARNLVWRAGWMLEHEPSEARRLVPTAWAAATELPRFEDAGKPEAGAGRSLGAVSGPGDADLGLPVGRGDADAD